MNKNTKAVQLKDTGERMIPEFSTGKLVYGEHMVRYGAIADTVKGRVVLDIASGSGYGTKIIAKNAVKVFGVDVSDEAISYAKAHFAAENIEYIKSDGKIIPLDDASVDVVVSFETIEHIKDYNFFMKEIKRVLKKDGLLVLSTPNDKEFPEGAHYHIHEFIEEELAALVGEYFSNTKNYYQTTWLYNAILPEASQSSEFEEKITTLNLAPVDNSKVLYFYMLCSNRQITEIINPYAAISEHWSTRDMLINNQKMDSYIKKTIKHYENILVAKDLQIEKLNDSYHELQRIKNSKTWKFIQKMNRDKLRSDDKK